MEISGSFAVIGVLPSARCFPLVIPVGRRPWDLAGLFAMAALMVARSPPPRINLIWLRASLLAEIPYSRWLDCLDCGAPLCHVLLFYLRTSNEAKTRADRWTSRSRSLRPTASCLSEAFRLIHEVVSRVLGVKRDEARDASRR